MELSTILDHAFNGNATLFLGSGFSKKAINMKNHELASADSLAEILEKQAGYVFSGQSLELAAEDYLEIKTERDLYDLLKQEYTIKNAPFYYDDIIGIEWRRIYTTNYDNLVEFAGDRIGRKITSITLSQPPAPMLEEKNHCIHLNGSILGDDHEAVKEEIKLTESSYLTNTFSESPWLKVFNDDLRYSKVIIFIGFSYKYDLDIKRIIRNTDDIKKKCIFMVRNDISEEDERRLNRHGQVIKIEIEHLCEEIKKQKSIFRPIPDKEKQLISFQKIELKDTYSDVTDEDIFKFFIKGEINESLILRSCNSPTEPIYAVFIERVNKVITLLKDGKKYIFVHSDLGNGKSVFIEELMCKLQVSYNCFKLTNLNEKWEDELLYIATEMKPAIVVVDNYSRFRALFRKTSIYEESIQFVLSERTILNEVLISDIDSTGKKSSIIELNRLTDKEADRLMAIFNKHKILWGEKANLDEAGKLRTIKGQCESTLQKILVEVVYSDFVIGKFNYIFERIIRDKQYASLTFLILFNAVFELGLNVDDVDLLLGESISRSANFLNDPEVKELVLFESDKFTVRSSVLSMILLRKMSESGQAFMALKYIAERADKYSYNKTIANTLKRIVIYSQLNFYFGKIHDFNDEVIKYYNGVKSVKCYENNPHFWLQFAIANLEVRNFEEAKKYFDLAYTYSEGEFGISFIDNHYARYLIENAIENGSHADAIPAMREAHELLKQSQRERSTYNHVFKVAINYEPLIKKYISELSKDEKRIAKYLCQEMLDMVDEFKRHVSKYHIEERTYIDACEAKMKILIRILS